MHRTVKLPYETQDNAFAGVLAELRRRQSRVMRSAYMRLVGGKARKGLYQALRTHPVGRGLHTWLLLSAMSKASSLYELRPDGGVVFGGKRWLVARSQGRISARDWKARRLCPLWIEGHARSFGTQGGNHLVSLDMAASRLIVHCGEVDYALRLKLSGRSRAYRRRLMELQDRCEKLRDTPFSIGLTDREARIGWKSQAPVPHAGRPDRALCLDLNPNRIGWAVVQRAGAHQSRSIAWGTFEYAQLNRRLGVKSNDPGTIAQDNKRRYELAVLARRIAQIGVRQKAGTVVTERLNLRPRSKGRGFNRLVHRCWFRNGFVQPLRRRLEESGLAHREVNPAYSSLIGNGLWAEELNTPDPACAALELGRRFFDPLAQDTREPPPMPNGGRLRKDGRRAAESSAALGGWARVWRKLNPTARDTPRRVRRRLRTDLRFGPPRRPSIEEIRSQVANFDPRPGASAPFGFDFSTLLAD